MTNLGLIIQVSHSSLWCRLKIMKRPTCVNPTNNYTTTCTCSCTVKYCYSQRLNDNGFKLIASLFSASKPILLTQQVKVFTINQDQADHIPDINVQNPAVSAIITKSLQFVAQNSSNHVWNVLLNLFLILSGIHHPQTLTILRAFLHL